MAYLYGFGFLYLLSAILGYYLSIVHILLIAGATYWVDRLIFQSKERLLMVLGSGMLLSVAVGIWLYRIGNLELIAQRLQDFLIVYYYSVSTATVFIGEGHQVVLLFLIGFVLMAVLKRFFDSKHYHYLFLLLPTIGLIVVTYLLGLLSSKEDRMVFLVMVGIMLIMYFYEYYRQHGDEKSFVGYVGTIGMFGVVVILGAVMLYLYDPRPLTRPVEVRQASDVTVSLEEDETSAISNFSRSNRSEIQNSFEYEYIELLRLDSEDVHYLKMDAYELYKGGGWVKDERVGGISQVATIYQSDAYDPSDFQSYYNLEEVTITLRHISTQLLPVSTYGLVKPEFEGDAAVYLDGLRQSYYREEPVGQGYSYAFQAVIPNYGNTKLDALIESSSDDVLPRGFGILTEPLVGETPQEQALFETVTRLALEVTDGIENSYEQAMAIESYLRANYAYTESPDLGLESGGMPIDYILHFLVGSKEGFCQHFASAQVLMMRSLGIPARYVTGFYIGDRYETYGDDYLIEGGIIDEGIYSIYDANAHSWAEAYFPEVGWIVFEATPGRYYRNDYQQSGLVDVAVDTSEENGSVFSAIGDAYNHWWLAGFLGAVCIFAAYVFLRWRWALRSRSVEERLLIIHHLIRLHLKTFGVGKHPEETVREYAERVDGYYYDSDELEYSMMQRDYESIVYGEQTVPETVLEGPLRYLWNLHKVVGIRRGKVQKRWLWWRMFIGMSEKYFHKK